MLRQHGDVINLFLFFKKGKQSKEEGDVRVRVAFRPTVSWPVRLGIKPILGLLTRNLFSSEV
jgi:hypothetical protein